MDEQRQCLVCSVSINSTRLGMDTCRACASFFKRAIVAGAQYLCRQGTFNCSSTRTNKFMCRYCRLTTCYRSGHGVRGADSSQEGLDPCASFRGIQVKLGTVLAMITRRRVREIEMIMTCENRIMVPVKEEIILKEYMVKFALVLSYYMTTKLFGDAQTKVMTSVCTCFDREMPLDFYYPGDDGGNKEFFKSSVRSHTTEHADLVLPQLTRSQLAEKEFHALAAIVLTEYDLRKQSRTIG
uniref:Nuclear receptor n=1 Tax=Pristionchus pacificus TaxID=54126 RepID=A0A2A6CJQ5_PRIPA|eukprot:PDM78336.1 nuclear receptor [Pristionchus pacificus]